MPVRAELGPIQSLVRRLPTAARLTMAGGLIAGGAAACAPQAAQGGQGSEVSLPLVTKAQSTAVVAATTTAEAKPAEVPTSTNQGGGTIETVTKAPEVFPQQKLAEEIGIPSKEPKEGWVKFTREVTEPKGEILYFDPNSLIGKYAAIDFRTVMPNHSWDTLFSVRDGLINRALEAETSLSSGKIEDARDQLTALKKRIEFQSKADSIVAKSSQGKIPDKDNNGDGVSDYLEPFYKGVVDSLARVQSMFK